MAFELAKEYKGITANYWKITHLNFNAISERTTVKLGLYESRRARNLDVRNFLDEKTFQFTGFSNLAECYNKIKESVPGTRVVTPAVYELDAEGNPKMPLVIVTPAVTEIYETNEFYNLPEV